MKRLATALVLSVMLALGASGPALAQEFWGGRPRCYERNYYVNGRIIICQTCCAFGNCTTTCYP